MKSSVQKRLLTLLLVVVVAGTQIEETSSEPNCLGTGASAEYEAYEAHVVDELANVTPTIEGYSYSTTFPLDGSPTAHEVVYGQASCVLDVGASDCVECLVEAKTSLGQICAFALAGAVSLPQCTMSFLPMAE